MLLTQALAQEPDVGVGVGVGVGVVGVGVGVGVPPPLPLVKGWNAWVKAPFFWVGPLQVDEAEASPGQPPLSRPSAQNESQPMPCAAACDSTAAASASVKISPGVSFWPIIGVLPSIA